MKSVKNQLRSDLSYFVSVGELNPDQMMKVLGVVDKALDTWVEVTTADLNKLARDWENTMGDANESFYSLGVRRAADIIAGDDALGRLPILETDTTPDPE